MYWIREREKNQNKNSPGGELGWRRTLESRAGGSREESLVWRQESEGSGIAGGMLVRWRLRHWSWGGSEKVPGGDRGRKEGKNKND